MMQALGFKNGFQQWLKPNLKPLKATLNLFLHHTSCTGRNLYIWPGPELFQRSGGCGDWWLGLAHAGRWWPVCVTKTRELPRTPNPKAFSSLSLENCQICLTMQIRWDARPDYLHKQSTQESEAKHNDLEISVGSRMPFSSGNAYPDIPRIMSMQMFNNVHLYLE